MIIPKQEVYEILQELDANVHQSKPEVVSEFPVIVFSMVDNSVTMSLDKNIGTQYIEFTVDIYTNGTGASLEASSLLSQAEALLREANYGLVYSADVPDPEENVVHISTRFNLVT